jgi:hypothetical protein
MFVCVCVCVCVCVHNDNNGYRYRHRSHAYQKEAGLLEEAEDFVNMCSNVIFWGHKEGHNLHPAFQPFVLNHKLK